METGFIISLLLGLLCCLATLDLWRQFAINSADYWFLQYSTAARSDDNFWKMGFRMEDLELKIDAQKSRWASVRAALDSLAPRFRLDRETLRQNQHDFAHTRQSRLAMHRLLVNDSAVVQIRCEKEGPLLRVGLNDYRTDPRDACQIFTTGSTSTSAPGPQALFEKVPLDQGAFALRALGSGLFVQAVPPPMDNSALPWKLVVGGPVVGSAERFRHTEEGYLYSGLIQGFFQCSAGQMVKGYAGKYGTYNKFIVQEVPKEVVATAQELIDLSKKITEIQKSYMESHQSSLQARKAAVNMVTGLDNPNPVKICIGVPMTSKGTMMSSVSDSPLWSNLFDSFMKSIDWRSNRFIFKFYLGFDKADALYDTGDAWSEIREEFKHRATFRMTEQLMGDAAIATVLEKQLTLKIMHFDHLEGAPTQVVSQLMLSAYVDNFDYFYQVNDDTIIVSPNWPTKLVSVLASNPSIPNFGVTGPMDTNNDKIFTHSFVHRTHIEVFGHLFPPSFKNWWSDDWITTVYGAEHTFWAEDVQIKHNVGAQKVKGYTRYEVDQGAQLRLDDELRKGHVQVDEWLKKNSLPRLPLPTVCGYVPLARHLAKVLRREKLKDTKEEEEDKDREKEEEA